MDVKFSRGHPDRSEGLRALPIHPSFQNTGREVLGGEDERVQRRLSYGQHVHSLHHGERPVRCQSLSHELGTIVPDPVTLEAVEARKRCVTNGAHKGTQWWPESHPSVTNAQGRAAATLSDKGL